MFDLLLPPQSMVFRCMDDRRDQRTPGPVYCLGNAARQPSMGAWAPFGGAGGSPCQAVHWGGHGPMQRAHLAGARAFESKRLRTQDFRPN
eukprot:1154781-Alexandrium_andersonii.AAC.1